MDYRKFKTELVIFEKLENTNKESKIKFLMDKLSKKALDSPMGRIYIEETIKGDIVNEDNYLLF